MFDNVCLGMSHEDLFSAVQEKKEQLVNCSRVCPRQNQGHSIYGSFLVGKILRQTSLEGQDIFILLPCGVDTVLN